MKMKSPPQQKCAPPTLPVEGEELQQFVRTFSTMGATPEGRRFIGDLIPRIVSRYAPDPSQIREDWDRLLMEMLNMRRDFMPAEIRGDKDIIEELGLGALCTVELLGATNKMVRGPIL